MTKQVYAIRDAKAEVYNLPFYQTTHGEAERSFLQLVNDEKSLVGKFPDDFDLYHIGTFDDCSGILKPLDTPLHITKAAHIKSQAVR